LISSIHIEHSYSSISSTRSAATVAIRDCQDVWLSLMSLICLSIRGFISANILAKASVTRVFPTTVGGASGGRSLTKIVLNKTRSSSDKSMPKTRSKRGTQDADSCLASYSRIHALSVSVLVGAFEAVAERHLLSRIHFFSKYFHLVNRVAWWPGARAQPARFEQENPFEQYHELIFKTSNKRCENTPVKKRLMYMTGRWSSSFMGRTLRASRLEG